MQVSWYYDAYWSYVWDVCACRVACIGPPDQLSNRSSYKNSISKAVVVDAMDSSDVSKYYAV